MLRDLFFRGTKTYVTSYGTGIASINGLGTPFVTIDWFEVAANSVSVFEDYDGTSLNVMTVAAELGIAPKPMVPTGTPVTVSWSWSGVSFATTEHESFSEDFCEVRDTRITIDGTEVTGGGFDLPAFTFPTKNQFAVFPRSRERYPRATWSETWFRSKSPGPRRPKCTPTARRK